MKYRNYGPSPDDFDTEEEYEAALEAWESALDDAIEEYRERRREE